MNDIIIETLGVLILTALPLAIACISFNTLRWLVAPLVQRNTLAHTTYRLLGLGFTPIHELSHLVVAMMFGHKIESVKLFAWNSDAYVRHSFNPQSTWQMLGNFFIAIAPFLTSTSVIYFLIGEHIDANLLVNRELDSRLTELVKELPSLIQAIVLDSSFLEIGTVVILCFYCTPSNADFVNATKAAIYSLPILALLSVVSALLSETYHWLGVIVIVGLVSSVASLCGWLMLGVLTLVPLNKRT